MTTYANDDAKLIAEGIRLGGKSEALDQAIEAAGEPLTASHLEDIARPDLGQRTPQDSGGYEHVGMLKIAATQYGYSIAAEWYGWLPGCYADRDAALIAYGYILGGEAHGYLDDLKKRWSPSITTDQLRAVAAP